MGGTEFRREISNDSNSSGAELVGARERKYGDVGLEKLTEEIHAIVGPECDLQTVTIGKVFGKLEESLELDTTSLDEALKTQLKSVVTARVQEIMETASKT